MIICNDCGKEGDYPNIKRGKHSEWARQKGWEWNKKHKCWLCPDCAAFPEIKGV